MKNAVAEAAPSTMLRMVPLPRFAGEEPAREDVLFHAVVEAAEIVV